MGTATVGTAGGPATQPVYPIRIQLQGVGLVINFSRVTGAPLKEMGLVALLGRDMLSNMILLCDSPNWRVHPSFLIQGKSGPPYIARASRGENYTSETRTISTGRSG